jgi:anti-sigma28 factor (negative regulator of flagellin synthesis)
MKLNLVVFFLLCFAFAPAQSLQDLVPKIEQRPRQITDTLDRDYDDRNVSVQQLPDNLKEKYSGADFDYEETTQEVDNIFSGFFDWLFRKLGSWFGIEISPFWATALQWLIYAIFATIAVYFIVRLLANEKASGIRARGKGTRNEIKIQETHIEEIDLNHFIKEAIANGNYRNAVRYLYLNSLKKLSASGKIDWDFQKTNSDYYRELKDVALKEQFKKVSYLYDYIWYGEFPIDESAFAKAQLEFDTLNKQAA